MAQSGNGLAYASIAGGAILAWSGIRGKQVSAVIRSLLSGKNPGTLPSPDQFTVSDSGGGGGGDSFSSDSQVANDAMQYQGVPYKWAGYTPSGWDCSGFVGWVLGHDLGLPLPGIGHWSGNYHPSVAASYLVWGQARAVGEASIAAGDIAVWPTHIGIVLGPNKMISALDPQYGTAVTPIHGFGPIGEPVSYRRIVTSSPSQLGRMIS